MKTNITIDTKKAAIALAITGALLGGSALAITGSGAIGKHPALSQAQIQEAVRTVIADEGGGTKAAAATDNGAVADEYALAADQTPASAADTSAAAAAEMTPSITTGSRQTAPPRNSPVIPATSKPPAFTLATVLSFMPRVCNAANTILPSRPGASG